MKQINLNKYEKIIDSIDKKEKILILKEYNINMGNNSYYKVLTNKDNSSWKLLKINKKSIKEISNKISHREIFNNLLKLAIK